MDVIYEALTYSFIQKAIIAGIFLSISSALLGIFLVLKKYSMIGDGLSHVSFFSVALAIILNKSPIIVSIPIVVLASLIIKRIGKKEGFFADSAIAMISSGAMALAMLLISLKSGWNVDINSYLFGSILAISKNDLILSIALSVVIIISVFLLYNKLVALTYDEDFCKALGMNTNIYNDILLILTSITIVLGMKMLGTLLISSLIIFPTVSALKISKSFKSTICLSVIFALISVICGIISSTIFNIPTGATIVLVSVGIYIILSVIKKVKR